MTDDHHGRAQVVWNACDVAIVGAGQAGMAAAHKLVTESSLALSVLVIEAADYIGGRTRNFDAVSGELDSLSDNAVELGGTWLSPEHKRTLELCRDLGLHAYNASFCAGTAENSQEHDKQEYPWWYWGSDYPEDQWASMGKSVFHTSSGSFAFRNPRELQQGFQASKDSSKVWTELEMMGENIDSAIRKMDADLGTSAPDWWARSGEEVAASCFWRECDAQSSRDYLALSAVAETRSALSSHIHGKNAAEPGDVSFLYNLISWRGCNSAGAEMQYRVRGGTQAIPVGIALKYGQVCSGLEEGAKELHQEEKRDAESEKQAKLKVVLNSVVRGIQFQKHDETKEGQPRVLVEVEDRSASGPDGGNTRSTLAARGLIVTGSPKALLHTIDFGSGGRTPRLAALRTALGRLSMGQSLKYSIVYEGGPWWREAGYQGDAYATWLPEALSLPPSGEDDGAPERPPLFVSCVDHTPFGVARGAPGVLAVFMEGRQHAHWVERLSEPQRRELLLQFLEHSFGGDARVRTTPARFSPLHDWSQQEFVRGAYTGYFSPGLMSQRQSWEAFRALTRPAGALSELRRLPLLVAGSDYHLGFGNGYIEGAVMSGQEAAAQVLELFGNSPT